MAARDLGAHYDPRRNNFDALRFVLATIVVWSHAYPLSGRPGDPLELLSVRRLTAGGVAVDTFFVVSGFLVAQSWLARPELASFVRNRALRILPALAVAVLAGAFVLGPFVTSFSPAAYFRAPATWRHLLAAVRSDALGCPGVFPGNPIRGRMNGSLWSLQYEFVAYVALALIGVLGRRAWTPVLVVATTCAWLAGASAGEIDAPARLAARLLACFGTGAVFYTVHDRVPWSPGLAVIAVGALAATALAGGFRVVFPVGGAYLILVAATADLGPLARFGRHGDFSYGMYVFAYPIGQTLVHISGGQIAVARLFPLTLVVTLAAAMLSWRYVEAPAIAGRFAPVPLDARP